MPLSLRSTFHLSNTGGIANPSGAHLMVCIMIDRASDKAAIVPIVSSHEFSDPSCVLHVGDHPFIQYDSCASYDHIQFVSIAAIDKQLAKGTLRLQPQVSAAVLLRLQVGLVKSDEVSPWAFREANGEALTTFLRHRGHI